MRMETVILELETSLSVFWNGLRKQLVYFGELCISQTKKCHR